MASETTAAANGKVGVVRHDPMAMLPFCGYNMAEYFQHWIDMGQKMTNPPRIFHVNWFRTDENDDFMWPGFGDNLRVILWMLNRCEGSVGAVETPLGYEPSMEDLDTTGLELDEATMEKLLQVDREVWKDEIKDIEAFYSQFQWLPKEITENFEKLKEAIL